MRQIIRGVLLISLSFLCASEHFLAYAGATGRSQSTAEFRRILMQGRREGRSGFFGAAHPDGLNYDSMIGEWLRLYKNALASDSSVAPEDVRTLVPSFFRFLDETYDLRTDSVHQYTGKDGDAAAWKHDSVTPRFGEDNLNRRMDYLAKVLSELIVELSPNMAGESPSEITPSVRDRRIIAAEAVRVLMEVDLLAANTSGSSGRQLYYGAKLGAVLAALGSPLTLTGHFYSSFVGGVVVALGISLVFYDGVVLDNRPWKRGFVPTFLRRIEQRKSYVEVRDLFWKELRQQLPTLRLEFASSIKKSGPLDRPSERLRALVDWIHRQSGTNLRESIQTIQTCGHSLSALASAGKRNADHTGE